MHCRTNSEQMQQFGQHPRHTSHVPSRRICACLSERPFNGHTPRLTRCRVRQLSDQMECRREDTNSDSGVILLYSGAADSARANNAWPAVPWL